MNVKGRPTQEQKFDTSLNIRCFKETKETLIKKYGKKWSTVVRELIVEHLKKEK